MKSQLKFTGNLRVAARGLRTDCDTALTYHRTVSVAGSREVVINDFSTTSLTNVPAARISFQATFGSSVTWKSEHLSNRRFVSDKEVKQFATTWLNMQGHDFCQAGILKLFPRSYKRLNWFGDYVKKCVYYQLVLLIVWNKMYTFHCRLCSFTFWYTRILKYYHPET